MIPILYEKTETTFTSLGLGRLTDCIRCIVTEERNGIYEAEFDYPVGGILFDQIQIGRIIGCTHDEVGDIQPFDIYRKSEPINGVVTFYAHHISYRLNELVAKPFTAVSCSAALAAIRANTIGTNPFTFWTDKDVSSAYTSEVPRSIRNMLGGEENSILDVYGTGEYEYDGWTVKLHTNRGEDTNVSIRYGKNLVDYNSDTDSSDSYTAVAPYWLGTVTDDEGDSSEELVTLSEWYISSGESVPSGREVMVPLDLSSDFDEPPTEAELRTKATNRLTSSDAWELTQTVAVNFVQLWQTDEYEDYAPLQQLKLCDTCGIFVPMYDTALRAKVIKVTWNALLDRYDSMELGDKPATYSSVITKSVESKVSGISTQVGSLLTAVGNITDELGNILQLFVQTEYTSTAVVYTAILLKNGQDISASVSNDLSWEAKLTTGYEFLGNGRSITIPKTDVHYAQTVTVRWTRRHYAYLLNNSGSNLVTSTGAKLVGRTEY